MAMTSGTSYQNNDLTGSTVGTRPAGDRTADRLAQGAHDTVDRLADRARPAVDRVASSMHAAADSLHARAGQLAEIEERWMSSARQTIRDNPLATVAIAVGVGMLLSKLLSSSR